MAKYIGIQDCHHISGLAVVIDVLRAFTVAPIALSQGASEIVLVETLEEALSLKAANPESLAFKDGPPQDEFDLFNSPAQLMELDVRGRTIFQRTTAGTRAAIAAGHCRPLLCASFVCATATARFIRKLDQEPTYVISGEDGTAEEDLSCARFIDALVSKPETDPAPFLRAANESPAAEDLRIGVDRGYEGIDPQDVEICLDVDRLNFCLVASTEDLGIVLRQVLSSKAA